MAIINLAVNGAEAMEDGGGTIVISCEPVVLSQEKADRLNVPLGHYCCVGVADSGAGLDDHTLSRMFDPFFTTKADKGAGLGLAMVHGFVTHNQGAIDVESIYGEGTKLSMYLPVTKAAAGGKEPTPAPVQETGSISPGIILLVEDNEDVRRVTRRQLVAMGAKVLEAETAEEAWDLLDTIQDATLLLCDVSLPGRMSGLDLWRKVEQDRPRLAMVLMTGHGADNVAASAPGAYVLQKPVSDADLSQAISSVFNGSQFEVRS